MFFFFLSCLDGNCESEDPCFFKRTGTIFHCPKGNLSSENDYITYEEWVPEDVSAQPFQDPLLANEPVILHGVPPTKRVKNVWKKRTTTRKQFVKRLFDLTPYAFQHHQLEMVQREQLRLHIESITKTNGLVVFWMDYPENANIIDRQEQQSDYYDRYDYFLFTFLPYVRHMLNILFAFVGRTKAVFFVLIVYYWDHNLDRVSCVSHTCVTPDLKKRNEQVTFFIEHIFDLYNERSKEEQHGRIKSLSMWSDNCGEQFKCKYHFGWGSGFLQSRGLLALWFNYFAPGHGKGICDSEGGIAKHAVADANIHGENLLNPYQLYLFLKQHCTNVASKTCNALHSPDRRDYHYFNEGEFLQYHPISLKINRINCYHAFCISRNSPTTLYSRNTSCFCEICRIGNFLDCRDVAFHGAYHTNLMDISIVEEIPDIIDLGNLMRERMLELRTSYEHPYLVMLYESSRISRPIFGVISPGANFNIATVRGHILDPLDPNTNYFNYTKVKYPVRGLCHLTNHNCPKKHTQLIRFDKICCICVVTTPAGKSVTAMKPIPDLSTPQYWVYDFKDTYMSLLEDYKKTRVTVFGNYQYTPTL